MTTRQLEDAGALDVARLVRLAAEGDKSAWERLVDQYARLIWAITRDFKLVESDAADVAQVTWLRLLENIHKIEHPDRVGSWLAATARNECLRSLAARNGSFWPRTRLSSRTQPHLNRRSTSVCSPLSGVRWFATHSRACRGGGSGCWSCSWRIPPASYAEISDQLGLPIGSIGPTRSRCLARLRALLRSS